MSTLIFPEDLRLDAFKWRKITIRVLKTKPIGKGIKDTTESLAQKYNSIKEVITNVDINKSNVDTNYRKNLEDTYLKSIIPQTEFTIILPLPNILKDNQGHEWNVEKGIIGTIGESLEGMTGSDLANAAGSVNPIAGKVANVATTITGTANISMGKAIGAASAAAGIRKPLIDPGYFQNYMGTKPRTWDMVFDLVPKNPKEAITMLNIIMRLKEYSSPETAIGGISILAPRFFDIEISNQMISTMAHLRGVVLTNISIDYGADGNMQQYPDGTPKYIQMSLTFAERNMMFAENYRNKNFLTGSKNNTKSTKKVNRSSK